MFRILLFEFEPRKLKINPTRMETFRVHLKKNVFRFGLLIMLTSFISMILFTKFNTKNLAEVSSSTSNILMLTLIGMKIFTTYFNQSEIWQLLKELQEVYDHRNNNHSNYKVEDYRSDYRKFERFYTGTFIFVILSVAFPLALYFITGRMMFKINFWFPFDPLQPLSFPFASLCVILAASFCLASALGSDLQLYAMISVLVMEYDFLTADFLKMNAEMSRDVAELIDRHNKLFDLSDKLQDIYKFSFLFSFVISSMILCLNAFQLSIAKDSVDEYLFYIPCLIFTGSQILLLCIFGQKLADSSIAVCDGMYEFGWEDIDDVALKKIFVLMIKRAQRSKQLTAMHFVDITLISFTSVRNFNFES